MITTGDKIKIFKDTNITAYKELIRDMGFKCTVSGEYLVVGKPYESVQTRREFSEQFKAKRLGMGLSKPEIAKRLGVSTYTIDAWESGFSKPKACNRQRVTDVMGIEFGNEVQDDD